MPELPDPSLAWEDLSAEDRRALTELLIDKIVIAPHPHKIVDVGATTSSAPSHTKIPSKRPRGSRRCTRPGSRSSPGSERRVGHRRFLSCAGVRTGPQCDRISREAAPWSNNRVTMLRVPSNPRSNHPRNLRSNHRSNRPSRSRRCRPSSTCNRTHGPCSV